MGFVETIHRIQKKPKRERERILLVSVTFSFLLIVILWIFFGGGIFRGAVRAQDEKAGSKDKYAPFEMLKEDFSSIFSQTREGIMKFKETLLRLKQ